MVYALFLFGCLRALGRLVLRRVPGLETGESGAALVEIAAGFALFSLLVRSLGFIGLASWVGLLAILGSSAWLLYRERPRIAEAVAALSTRSLPWRREPGLFVLAAVALIPLPMALAPAVSLDALVYQLRFPEMTLRTGVWAIDPTNSPSFFPAATETLYLATLLVDSSGIAAQLVHYGFFLLSLAALVVLGRRLSGDARSGVWAAVLFASVPAASIVAGWSWSDMSLCFVLLAACIALLDGAAGTAFLLAGLAASVKYSGIPFAVPVAAAAAWIGMRRRRFGEVAAGFAAGLLVALPWYVSNALRTGNPVYPLLPSVFGGSGEAARRILEWSRASSPGEGGAWSDYVLRPRSLDADIGGILLAVLLAAGAVYCFLVRRMRAPMLLLLAAIALLAPFSPAARILLPAIAGASLFAGIAIQSRPPGGWRTALGVLVALVVLRGAGFAAAHNALFFNPMPCAVGVESERAYTFRNRREAPLFERAAAVLPEDARVLVFGDSKMFGFPRPTVASAIVDPPAVGAFLRGASNPGEVRRRLAGAGITHLLVSMDSLRAPAGASWRRGLTPADLALLERLVQEAHPLDRQGPLVLLDVSGGNRGA